MGKSANFPYATIDPEEARIPVPDERFDWLVKTYKPASVVPAFLTCIDIAGLTAVQFPLYPVKKIAKYLVQGASTGAGLGNAFLSHVRAVDGIFQVVRAFDDAEVIHVEGEVNPIRDMEVIQTELRLKDIEWVEKALDNLKKTGRSLGPNSMAGKQRNEEIVRAILIFCRHKVADMTACLKAVVEKILKTLTVDEKDVRKVDWGNKEVCSLRHSIIYVS